MKKMMFRVTPLIVFVMVFISISAVYAQEVRPIVFQAAGPDAASIQGTVDAYRAALGEPNNGSNAGPLVVGRREINWDGGGSDATTAPVTPFDVFLNSRGARFTTDGAGMSQAPVSGGANGGLAVLFNNPSYATTFTPFSALRLFTPVGSRFTDGLFFIPGSGGGVPAVVSGFGAIFTDVDKPDAKKAKHSTRIEYFDAQGNLIYTGLVPSSPGDGHLSFFGIVFPDARIRRVQIRTGDLPGGKTDGKKDIVMMDDFFYGEPQPIQP